MQKQQDDARPEDGMDEWKLNDKQKLFSQNVVSLRYSTAKAAFVAAGYSPVGAAGAASRALASPGIKAYITYLKQMLPSPQPAPAELSAVAERAEKSEHAAAVERQAVADRQFVLAKMTEALVTLSDLSKTAENETVRTLAAKGVAPAGSAILKSLDVGQDDSKDDMAQLVQAMGAMFAATPERNTQGG
jgi:phage terminase small subunit